MGMYVLATEFVGKRHRHVAGTSLFYSWALGLVTLAGLAYAVRDWRMLSIMCSAPGLISILAWRWVNIRLSKQGRGCTGVASNSTCEVTHNTAKYVWILWVLELVEFAIIVSHGTLMALAHFSVLKRDTVTESLRLFPFRRSRGNSRG